MPGNMCKQHDRTLTILLPPLTATAVSLSSFMSTHAVWQLHETKAKKNGLRRDLIGSYHMRSKSSGLPVVTLTVERAHDKAKCLALVIATVARAYALSSWSVCSSCTRSRNDFLRSPVIFFCRRRARLKLRRSSIHLVLIGDSPIREKR